MLAATILAFTVAVSAVGFWKYHHYRYHGLDLAIAANVLWNLSHGGGWWSSIQGSSYLGDHVEPILLAIAPLFRIWPDPRLLIILQALALGLTAVPVFLLLTTRGSRFGVTGLWLANPLLWNAALFEFHALSFAPVIVLSAAVAWVRRRFGWFCCWLLLSLSVREDVALIVAMFGVVEAVRMVRRSQDIVHSARGGRASADTLGHPSVVASLKSLGRSSLTFARVRDTMPAPVAPWSAEARPSPRSRRSAAHWIIAPVVGGVGWFLLATRIAATHHPAGAYPFLTYYGWLLNPGTTLSFPAVLTSALAHPIRVLAHFMAIGNVDMLLGLLLPFLFLPLLQPQWLLLTVPPLLEILLAAPGGSSLIIETHYGLLFLPGFALAAAAAIDAWRRSEERTFPPDDAPQRAAGFERCRAASDALRCPPTYFKDGRVAHRYNSPQRGTTVQRVREFLRVHLPLPRSVGIGIAVFVVLASSVLLGPFRGIVEIAARGASPDDRARRAAYDALLAHVPPDAPIAVSYAALPHVASRRGAYSLAYAFLGVTQFAAQRYVLPPTVQYLVLDQRDAIAYAVQFPHVGWAAPHAVGGAERLRAIITAGGFGVVAARNGIALFERGRGDLTIDQRYLAPDQPIRGRLTIDALRDVTVNRMIPRSVLRGQGSAELRRIHSAQRGTVEGEPVRGNPSTSRLNHGFRGTR